MRRIICAIATLVTLALLACFPNVVDSLPAPPEGLTALPYKGWSGVIQVWVSQSWRSGTGSFVPWLNEQFAAFEKRNQGIYMQVVSVPQSRFEQLKAADFARPDILIYSPGEVDSAISLMELSIPEDAFNIRPDLLATCVDGESLYGLPLALGGYGALLRSEAIVNIPADWETAVAELYVPATRREKAHYALQVSGDRYFLDAAHAILGEIPAKSDMLPSDYMSATYIKAQSDFKNGIAFAIVGSQWNLRQMELLDNQGKGFGYEFAAPRAGWTNQMLVGSIVNTGRADADERASVCTGILKQLVGEDAQTALQSALAFPVLNGLTLYQTGHMAELEQSLQPPLQVSIPGD